MDLAQEMLALEDIKRLKARYFRCLDTKDWDGFAAVFAPDAEIDTTESFTPKYASGELVCVDGVSPPAPNPAWRFKDIGAFLDDVRTRTEGISTVHHGHMPEISFTSATTARGIWAMEDIIRWPKGGPIGTMHGYGHYHETYERGPAGWRIKTLKLTRVRIDMT